MVKSGALLPVFVIFAFFSSTQCHKYSMRESITECVMHENALLHGAGELDFIVPLNQRT